MDALHNILSKDLGFDEVRIFKDIDHGMTSLYDTIDKELTTLFNQVPVTGYFDQ
jgi:hypothetical protein